MSGIDDFLAWDEPDSGCVSCGKPYMTVADHRCGECLGQSMHHCPHCLDEISDVIDREIVSRLRQASHDVNDTWLQGGYFDRIRDRQRVLEARRKPGGAT